MECRLSTGARATSYRRETIGKIGQEHGGELAWAFAVVGRQVPNAERNMVQVSLFGLCGSCRSAITYSPGRESCKSALGMEFSLSRLIVQSRMVNALKYTCIHSQTHSHGDTDVQHARSNKKGAIQGRTDCISCMKLQLYQKSKNNLYF